MQRKSGVRVPGVLLVAGPPQGGALAVGGPEGVSVGQQRLPELGVLVALRVTSPCRRSRQLHRLVEEVVLRGSEARRLVSF